MALWNGLLALSGGNTWLAAWLGGTLAALIGVAIWRGFFRVRKIQPNGFKWKKLRNEIIFGAINIAGSALLLGGATGFLTSNGYISFNDAPAAWWVIALEFVAYWVLFDTWFYWFHRLMHKEPMYTWVHKLHHYSTSPNVMTTLSVNPLESLINGGFVPLFTAALTVHSETMLLIGPTNIIMGLYVHSGYEFFPRWWNKSWATKWFITASFHDHHHKYFTGNFGGYTTVWDRICGTMRPKWEADYDKICARRAEGSKPKVQPEAEGAPA